MANLRRDVETLVQTLVTEHGCKAVLGKGHHWKVTLPGKQMVTISYSPSDQRAIRNIRQDIRRHLGIEL